MAKTKLLILCPGMGIYKRGFEVSYEQLVDALSPFTDLEVSVAQSAPSAKPRHYHIKHIGRDSWTLKTYNKFRFRERFPDVFFFEQTSFFNKAKELILELKPDVINTSHILIARKVEAFIKKHQLKSKLIFSNGGPNDAKDLVNDAFFIHQKSLWCLDDAEKLGMDMKKQQLIPNGFYFKEVAQSKEEIRQKYELPGDKKIILSIGAIDRVHKRIDYLISECKPLLESGEYFLICLGNTELETAGILREFKELIDGNKLLITKVSPDVLPLYIKAADVFIHSALFEGFGRSIVEAMYQGKPCILHQHKAFTYLGADLAFYIDMREKGNLLNFLLNSNPLSNWDSHKAEQLKEAMEHRFSWKYVAKEYYDYFMAVANQ